MGKNVREEEFEHIELFGKPALFSNHRIDRDTVPEGFYLYDLRGSDNDPGRPITMENRVAVNHAGAVLTAEPVKFQKEKDYRRISGKINFLGEQLSLAQFCEKHDLTLLPDPRKYILRPATENEVGLFYSASSEKDAQLATVGHLRQDFGSGDEFHSTWWPHNEDAFNTVDFKTEFDAVVNELRKYGPLKRLSEMSSFCYAHGGALNEESFGYITESERYRYAVRCTPMRGNYNCYIYSYDKHQQELNMKAAEKPIIGTVSFASGETLAYTDHDIFVQVIKNELPYKGTSGFQYEVLTDDPVVRKAVDDVLYDMFGEDNPRPLEDYGLTEQGRKALRDAENPNLPHKYDWFVVENFGCEGEVRHDFESLTGAIDKFNGLASEEKRLCITKDDVSTIYLAIAHAGEIQLEDGWQDNPRFATDPTIEEAAQRLQLSIAGLEPSGPTMTLGGM